MKITIGEWRMRNGHKAIAGAINETSVEPVIGWRSTKEGILVCRSWQTCGKYYKEGPESEYDLIAPWTEPVPWDWGTTPPWINWIAMDANGHWSMYISEPDCGINAWNTNNYYTRIPPSHDPKWTGDWKLSKTQRPKEVAK